jgi:hypothetical protein
MHRPWRWALSRKQTVGFWPLSWNTTFETGDREVCYDFLLLITRHHVDMFERAAVIVGLGFRVVYGEVYCAAATLRYVLCSPIYCRL